MHGQESAFLVRFVALIVTSQSSAMCPVAPAWPCLCWSGPKHRKSAASIMLLGYPSLLIDHSRPHPHAAQPCHLQRSDTRVQCTAAHPVGTACPDKQFFYQSEGIRSTFTSASSILCCPFIATGLLPLQNFAAHSLLLDRTRSSVHTV